MLLNHPPHPVKKTILYHRRNPGFNECLSYLLMPNEDTVLHKDFALSRHFLIETPDLSVSSTVGTDSTAHIWRQSLQFLDDGWMLETNVVSEPFFSAEQNNAFSEHIPALLDEERQLNINSGRYFTTKTVLSLTYKPKDAVLKQQRWFDFEKTARNPNTAAFDKQLQLFNQVVTDFTGFLSQVLVSLQPLQGNALVEYLHQCITEETTALTVPSVGGFLDNLLASEDFIAGMMPKIGDKFIQVLAIDQLPAYSYPMMLESLSQFPMCYRWSTRFVPLGKTTAETYLKRYQRHWSSKAIGVMGVLRGSFGLPVKLDGDAQQVADTLDDAMVSNRSGQTGFGFYSSVIVLMHENKAHLTAMAQAIKQTIQQGQFKVREERLNNTEAYLGSLPGHGDYNVRKLLVDTDYLSHALPISQLYQGHAQSPCPLVGYHQAPSLLITKTAGNRPFFLNLHVNDVGHTLVLGATGSGKSTLISMLLCGHRRYADSRIVVLDKDFSQRLAVYALNGQYIRLGEDEETALAPLVFSPDNDKAIDVALRWLSDFMEKTHVTMTAKKQQLLREALVRLAHEASEFKNLNHLHVEEPSLRDGLKALNSGAAQKILNGCESPFLLRGVLGIDCGQLLQGNTLSAQTVCIIDALFNVLNEVFADQRPTLLVLEEAWLYLKHPLFQAKFSDWLKTLRKSNVAVVLVSQEVADIANSPLQSVIQSACMTRIYCPNRAAQEIEIAKGYQAFGLTPDEVALIANLVPKQEYYYHSPEGAQVFQLDLGDTAKALLCQTNKVNREYLETLLSQQALCELMDWFESEGLTLGHEFLRNTEWGNFRYWMAESAAEEGDFF